MGKAAREKREARAEEAASASKPSFLIDLNWAERIALIQFFRLVAPKAKGYEERQRRKALFLTLHIQENRHFKILQNERGAALVLGRFTDGGETFQPLKKGGRRLYGHTEMLPSGMALGLNADRIAYLVDLLKDAEIPPELEAVIVEIEDRLRAVRAGKHALPDVPAAGEGEVYAETPEQENADDQDDTEDAAE